MLALTVLLLLMWLVFRPAYQLTKRAIDRQPAAEGHEQAEVTPREPERPVALPENVTFDEYVHRGLADLRILLIQSARRPT